VLGLDEAHAGAGERAGRIDFLAGALVDRLQPAFVDNLGDKAARVGMHSPRTVEEDPELRRDSAVLTEQVLKH